MKVGTLLELQRDQENPYDKNAVAVVYSKVADNNEKEEYLIGYLPRTSNTEIAQLLEMGWASIFECRISKINEDAHYENQIRLTIRIKQNQQAQNCV